MFVCGPSGLLYYESTLAIKIVFETADVVEWSADLYICTCKSSSMTDIRLAICDINRNY